MALNGVVLEILVLDQAAIGVNSASGDVTGLIGRQKRYQIGHIIGLADLLGGNLVLQLNTQFRVAPDVLVDRCGNRAGTDRHCTDVMLGQRDAHALCQHRQARLRGAVMRERCPRNHVMNTGDIDDDTPAVLLDHLPRPGLSHQKRPSQIHIQDILPILERHFPEICVHPQSPRC